MGRFLAGVCATLLLVGAVVLFWKSAAGAEDPIPAAPAGAGAQAAAAIEAPPEASERTREQKRFDRYDKDRDGRITREEYLASRRKAYAKLDGDGDGDGRLSFDEWAVRSTSKFAGADTDRTGAMDAAEFATTKIVRKTPVRSPADCPPATAPAGAAEED